MDKNVYKGAHKEREGVVREVVGDVTGDTTEKLAGKVERAAGTVQRKYGEAKTVLKRNI